MTQREAVIVEAVRTAVGRRRGAGGTIAPRINRRRRTQRHTQAPQQQGQRRQAGNTRRLDGREGEEKKKASRRVQRGEAATSPTAHQPEAHTSELRANG